MNLYHDESSYHGKYNAQRNLCGRTHYVDDDTLRFHKSRVIYAKASSDGLLFYLVESCARDMNNQRRGFRYIIFDVFGTVVGTRAKLDDMWSTSNAATKAMWKEAATLDPIALTAAGIANAEKWHKYDMDKLREELAKLQTIAA